MYVTNFVQSQVIQLPLVSYPFQIYKGLTGIVFVILFYHQDCSVSKAPHDVT